LIFKKKKKCLLLVYLPIGEMARVEFLARHFEIVSVIASANAGVAGPGETRLIDSANAVVFSLRAAKLLLGGRPEHDFIYVIGLPALIAFRFVRPRRPLFAYAPTHYLQHFGDARQLGGAKKLSAWLKTVLFMGGLRRATSLMAISRQLEALYLRHVPRVVMIPMGVDLALYSKPAGARPAAGLNIVYPGSGGPGRGIELILACAARIVREERAVVFHMVGCKDALLERELDANPSLRHVIRVYPPMPNAEVVKMYWSMDCGISLLERNPFYEVCPPQKIFEYMAASLPILCNNIETHTDYVGASALVFDYSAEALHGAVLEMLENKALFMARAEEAAGHLQQYAHATVERSFVAELEQQLADR
jgi:glycosyltransferase involved in cell wall biosynthesis